VTRSFEGVWKKMSRNERGILMPPPILEAINLRNPEGERNKLILFQGEEITPDLTYGLVRYLRAYDMNGVHEVESYSMKSRANIKRMRFRIPEVLEDVLPLGNRAGIVGFENYFDIMDPIDIDEYIDLISEEDGFDDSSEYL